MQIVGAEGLVRSAVRLAGMLRVSPLIVGLTVVAWGTSAPELAVSAKAAVQGHSGLAVANVVGSNVFNVLFILGLSALVAPLTVANQVVRLDVPVMIGVSALCLVFGIDGDLSRSEGIALLVGLLCYTASLLYLSRRQPPEEVQEFATKYFIQSRFNFRTFTLSWGYGAGGLALWAYGSRLLVDSATDLARFLGVNDAVMGLSIVAAGTSLPEVATSVTASLRSQREIAVGNVVGSNIFNVLGVMGLSSLLSRGGLVVLPAILQFDLPIMLAVAIACLPVFATGLAISRWEGAVFLAYYLIYTVLLVMEAVGNRFLPLYRDVVVYCTLPLTACVFVASLVRAELETSALAEDLYSELEQLTRRSIRRTRKALVFVASGTVVLIGLAMLVLPGPGILAILVGLFILGTEFLWARHLLSRVQREAGGLANRIRGGRARFLKVSIRSDACEDDRS